MKHLKYDQEELKAPGSDGQGSAVKEVLRLLNKNINRRSVSRT